jgi:hypothetical protein
VFGEEPAREEFVREEAEIGVQSWIKGKKFNRIGSNSGARVRNVFYGIAMPVKAVVTPRAQTLRPSGSANDPC